MSNSDPNKEEPRELLNRSPGIRGGLSTMCYINEHRSCLHHRIVPGYCRCECHERSNPAWWDGKSGFFGVMCFDELHEACTGTISDGNVACQCYCHELVSD